jgi:hypothetical protein
LSDINTLEAVLGNASGSVRVTALEAVVEPGVALIVPDGTDSAGSCSPTGAATLHAATDEGIAAADDNTTYINCASPFTPAKLTFQDTSLAGPFSRIILRSRGANGFGAGGGLVNLYPEINGVQLEGTRPALTGSYAAFEHTLYGFWTQADVNTLKLTVSDSGGIANDWRMTAFEFELTEVSADPLGRQGIMVVTTEDIRPYFE